MQGTISNLGLLEELEFRRGADLGVYLELFQTEVGGEPYDMTGCEVRACIKARSGSDGPWNFTVAAPPDSTGVVLLQMADTVTTLIPASPSSTMAVPLYDWYVDIRLADGRIIPFCYGPAYCREGGPSWL